MSRMKLFALEDEVVDEVTDNVDDVLDEENQESNELSSNVEEIAGSVLDGADAAEELTEVKDVMDQSIETGAGLDPVAAEMARISIRNILSNIGAEHYSTQLMVASEAFGSTSSRLANTRYASEGLGDFLSNLFTKIRNRGSALKDLFSAWHELFMKNTASLIKMVKELRDKVNTAELTNEKKLISADKLKNFNYSNTSDILAGIKLHSEALSQVNNISENFLRDILPSLKNDIKVNKNETPETIIDKTKLKTLYFPSTTSPLYDGKKFKIETSVSDINKVSIIKNMKTEYVKKDKISQITLESNKAKLLSILDKTLEGLVTGEKEARQNVKHTQTMLVYFLDTNTTINAVTGGNNYMLTRTAIDAGIAKIIGFNVVTSYYSIVSMIDLTRAVLKNTHDLTRDIIKYVNLCLK